MPRRMTKRAPIRLHPTKGHPQKRCTSCERWRSIKRHYYLKKDGKPSSGWCKDCTKQYSQEFRRDSPFKGLPREESKHKAKYWEQKGKCWITGNMFHDTKPWMRPALVRMDGELRWVWELFRPLFKPHQANTSSRNIGIRLRKAWLLASQRATVPGLIGETEQKLSSVREKLRAGAEMIKSREEAERMVGSIDDDSGEVARQNERRQVEDELRDMPWRR